MVTLNPNALKRWSLILYKCNRIIKEIGKISDANAELNDVTVHKEEMPGRIEAIQKIDKRLLIHLQLV